MGLWRQLVLYCAGRLREVTYKEEGRKEREIMHAIKPKTVRELIHRGIVTGTIVNKCRFNAFFFQEHQNEQQIPGNELANLA